MNKLAVATRADSGIEEMCVITHPVIKRFCAQWGADFHIINAPVDCPFGDGVRHFRIMHARALLEEYDRVLVLDSDMIITPHCPNPFETVPEDCIGTIFEDVGSRQEDRRKYIAAVQQHWGDVGWTEGYINTGFFLCSRQHKDIFRKVFCACKRTCHNGYWTAWGSDDVQLGWTMHKDGHKIHQLPFQWNHMTMFSEPWCGADRFKSFIIHYAGNAVFDNWRGGVPNRHELIKDDMKKIWGESS